MNRALSLALALYLLASSVSAQIIGGGMLGGGNPGYPPKYAPALWLDSSQGCYTDAAIQFTAADKSWLTIADASQAGLDLGTDDGIWSVWLYCDSIPNVTYIIQKGGSAGSGVGNPAQMLQVNTNGSISVGFSDGSATRISATTGAGTVTVGTWTHLAVYFDRSGSLSLYKNGTSVAFTSGSDVISGQGGNQNSTEALNVGSLAGLSGYFLNGRLDSLMFFKKPDLSPYASDIISWAYNAGAGRMCSEITPPQETAWGAISGWELGEVGATRSDTWSDNDLTESHAEMTTNGTFTGNATGWNLGTGWAYGTNNITATAADTNATQTTVVPTVGHVYATSFVVSGSITGTVRLQLGGASGTTRSTAATFVENLTATTADTLVIDPVATFSGTVDTVSVMATQIFPAPGIVRGLCVDGDDLSYWVDRSGSGKHASIVTLAMRPIYETHELNSLPILDFDGIDDRLETALQGLQAATIFAVVKGGADGDGYVGVNDSMLGVAAGPVIAGVVASHTTATVKSDEDPTADYRIVCLSYAGDAAAESLHVDGTQEYAGTQSGAVTVDADTYTVGAVDSGGTIGTFGDCQIASILIYNRALSASERNAVTAWLQRTYALAP